MKFVHHFIITRYTTFMHLPTIKMKKKKTAFMTITKFLLMHLSAVTGYKVPSIDSRISASQKVRIRSLLSFNVRTKSPLGVLDVGVSLRAMRTKQKQVI